MATQQPAPQDKRDSQGRTSLPRWWWVLAAVLLTWSIFPLLQRPESGLHENNYTYSAFLEQVRSNNVKAVQISGDRISGDFVQPVVVKAKGQPSRATYTSFHTTFPSGIGDASLIPLLESHGVVIDVSPVTAPWYAGLLSWLPFLLLVGYFIWMSGSVGRQLQQSGGPFGFGRIKEQARIEAPDVTFNDVAGVAEAKTELQEEVDFLRNPEKYHVLGARIPRGILLVGAPGTGKTLLARAVAGEAHVPFFSLNGSEFVEMFVGVGASRVRDLFAKAKEAAPAIVFIDELDAVGRRRGAGLGTVNDEREQTLNQLLGELDGFDPRAEVIVLAATNRPDVLDPALLRPGRFDRQVVIDLPDATDRLGILTLHARKLKTAGDADLDAIARATIGLSGADLANLCNEAALIAAQRSGTSVTMADFNEATDKIRLGGPHRKLADPSARRIVAYHESGHAVTAWLTPQADPVQKVTIVPRGQALGQTEQLPETEQRNLSLSYLKARLAVLIAGRTAEEIVFGEITTGAESDLVEATKLARRMVTRWGMGDLGLVAFSTDEQQPFLGYEMSQGREYSDSTAALVDLNIRNLLDATRSEVRERLQGARHLLDRLAGELLKTETVGPEDLQKLLGPRVDSNVA
jgi:cell division protease FtsH